MNAAMRRKDFELIAAALKASLVLVISEVDGYGNAAPLREGIAHMQHRRCCDAVAEALRKQYPAFDRERFLRDCGVQP